MSVTQLQAQVKTLEWQLHLLKGQLERVKTSERGKSLADLHGLLAGKSATTEQELQQAKYRPKWEYEREGEHSI